MNRRRLFGSLLALLTAPVAFARRTPRLHGDGVHDDAEAMQALINGERVMMPDGSIQQRKADQTVYLPAGIIVYVGSDLTVPPRCHIHGSYRSFGTAGATSHPMLRVSSRGKDHAR